MKTAVRYFTRSGNTRALAQAIAAALGIQAEDVNADLTENVDTLFLGCSVYAGKYDPAVERFLEKNAERIAKIVLFGSSASGKSVYAKLKELAGRLGIAVENQQFACYGHFLFLHKNHPDKQDLDAAADFAKRICEGLKA